MFSSATLRLAAGLRRPASVQSQQLGAILRCPRNIASSPPLLKAVEAEVGRASTSQSSAGSRIQRDQHFEASETEAKGDFLNAWIAPGTAVYVNPICSQLDQLLLKCDETESVLALLVTHRGVFFVHNLVTAIQVLGALAEEKGDHIAVNRLLRDPRYDVLIRDLLRFVPKLDFLAMTNIVCSLKQLDHKYYMLFSRMLRPLLQQPPPDVSTLLRCIQAYSWAGYHQQTNFYAHCAGVLTDSMENLDPDDLVQACVLLGGASHYQGRFFEAAERRLLSKGEFDESGLSPRQVVQVADAFTAHLRTTHDGLLAGAAMILEREAENMEPRDIVRCLSAFRRVALRFDGAMRAGLHALTPRLQRAWLLRQRADGLQASDVATALECAAYFGIRTKFDQVALDYLDDRADEVSERASIQTVYAMCVSGGVASHSRLLLYLFRKIGAGTAWEAHRMRIFHLWVSQLLQFPWLDARLKRRCIDAGLRAWCLHRRGYGSPFPDEVREVAAELEAMGVSHRAFVPVPETPYEVDIAIRDRKDALLVISETARNTLEPVGSVLLQMKHLQDRGWKCVVIPRKAWRGLAPGPGGRESYLRSLLATFQDPLHGVALKT
eukprot:TRINITY_DN49209_c0_g1_i1.p1 TRINITY_DN49209_c0_g1~~TRINITY_DN49209_c0_g1_i1.p1  ORF type:complete len:623 (+),score=84.54 TRINITY_DN49209_c0_g1_i1:50-1870(+)